MPNRVTKVTLSLDVQGFQANLAKAKAGVTDFASQSHKSFKKNADAWNKIGSVALVAGGAMAAGIGLAVKKYADFSDRMAQVKSLSGASTSQMNKLTKAALKQGQAYGLSANQVADAQIELVKAGLSAKDMLGGALKGALTLAAAGQINVADATQYATIAMTQFGLKAGDIPHLADLMAAGADRALGSVADLGEALSNGGTQAASMGVGLEQTIGTLAMFAQNGIIGAEAGTQLRSMFIALQKPSAKAQDVMDEYGISVYNASGKFVGMSSLAEQLKIKLGGLTQEQRQSALATMFGSYAIQSANILYKEGAKGVDHWTNAVNEAGFAQKQAAGKMDSLGGDIKKLQAAWETALISFGSGNGGAARGLTKGITSVLNGFSDLPEWERNIASWSATAVAGILLVGGGSAKAAVKVSQLRKELSLMGPAGTLAGKGVMAAGKAIGIAGAVLVGLQVAGALDTWGAKTLGVTKSSKDLTKALSDGKSVASEFQSSFFSKGMVEHMGQLADKGDKFRHWYTNFAAGLPVISGGAKEASKNWKTLDTSLASMVTSGNADKAKKSLTGFLTSMNKEGKGFGGFKVSLNEALSMLPKYTSALTETKSATQIVVSENGTAIKSVKQLTKEQKKAVEATQEAYKKAASINMGSSLDKSLKTYLADLDKQKKSVKNWASNMQTLAAKGLSQDALDYLASMGTDAAPMIAKLVKGSKSQLKKFQDDIAYAGGDASKKFADNLIANLPVINSVASKYGQSVANKFATALNAKDGGASLQKLLKKYKASITKDNQTGQMTITFNTKGADKAKKDAKSVKSAMDTLKGVVTGKIKVDGSPEGKKKAKSVRDALKLVEDVYSGKVKVDGDKNAKAQAGKVLAAFKKIPGGSPYKGMLKVVGQDAVKGAVAAARTALTAFNGAKGTGTIHVKRVYDGKPEKNANGNIYLPTRRFADGDENHTAQIAPAGAMRLWAEPETGGEAYIPLAKSKRGRSKRILENVANRFGMGLVALAEGSAYVAAKRDRDNAYSALQRAKRSKKKGRSGRVSAAQQKYDDAKSRFEAVEQSRFENTRSSVRGEVSADFTAGTDEWSNSGALSRNDSLWSISRDKNYTPEQRSKAAALAKTQEAAILRLTKEQNKAADAASKAKGSFDDLRSGVYSSLSTFDLTALSSTSVTDLGNGLFGAGAGGSAGAIDSFFAGKSGSFTQFQSLMEQLKSRGYPGGLIAYVASLGPDSGSQLARTLLSASDSQVRSISSNYTSVYGDGVSDEGLAGRVADAVAGSAYGDAVKSSASSLESINKQIAGLGKDVSDFFNKTYSGTSRKNANGGLYTYANASGGIYSGVAGSLYKFAEPETRWEAFVSGKPGQETRNRGIALEAYSRLGGVMPQPVQVQQVVYVQNPWTGQYHEAQMSRVAQSVNSAQSLENAVRI